MPAGRERMLDRVAGLQQGAEEGHILVNRNGAVASIASSEQSPAPAALFGGKRLLLVAWCQPGAVWGQPNLQQMQGLRDRRVEFTVPNAGASTHSLNFAR